MNLLNLEVSFVFVIGITLMLMNIELVLDCDWCFCDEALYSSYVMMCTGGGLYRFELDMLGATALGDESRWASVWWNDACDYHWFTSSGLRCAFVGGKYNDGVGCGLFGLDVNCVTSYSIWFIGA